MKVFLSKALCLILITYFIVIGVNYKVDPALLYHSEVIDAVVEKLTQGNIVYSPGDLDEGIFNKKMIQSLRETPDVVIIGSSHVMYVPWEYDNYFVAGLSGASMGDYYALIGLLEDGDALPDKVIFGIDPWAFMTSYSNGNHTSIKKYALEEYVRINGEVHTAEAQQENDNFLKIKELTSFSYFQSSFRKIRANGISTYLQEPDETVRIVNDDALEADPKILPNCRRIMGSATLATVEENTALAEQTIKDGAIYQLGTELKMVDAANFKDFEKLVFYLQQEGVDVEFYLPSWYPVVYDFFENSENFKGVIEVEDKVRELGSRLDIVVHGSYDPELCGAEADDFADWLHIKAENCLKNYNTILE